MNFILLPVLEGGDSNTIRDEYTEKSYSGAVANLHESVLGEEDDDDEVRLAVEDPTGKTNTLSRLKRNNNKNKGGAVFSRGANLEDEDSNDATESESDEEYNQEADGEEEETHVPGADSYADTYVETGDTAHEDIVQSPFQSQWSLTALLPPAASHYFNYVVGEW